MICVNCNTKIERDEDVYYNGDDEPICRECFDEYYTCCDNCSDTISRNSVYRGSNDQILCYDCYQDETDDLPDNPPVDRKEVSDIIKLSRNFLKCKGKKYFLRINENDYMLPELRHKVGLLSNSFKVFGVGTGSDIDIKASPDIIEDVKICNAVLGMNFKVAPCEGKRKLGLSFSSRNNRLNDAVKLIKSLSRRLRKAKLSKVS